MFYRLCLYTFGKEHFVEMQCQLTQNKMLNPNKKYFTQQLTSAPLK